MVKERSYAFSRRVVQVAFMPWECMNPLAHEFSYFSLRYSSPSHSSSGSPYRGISTPRSNEEVHSSSSGIAGISKPRSKEDVSLLWLSFCWRVLFVDPIVKHVHEEPGIGFLARVIPLVPWATVTEGTLQLMNEKCLEDFLVVVI